MRKYWKSIAVITGIVLSMGTFYINSAMSAEHYPEFAIQHVSGDAQEVQSMVLEGSYVISPSMNYVSTDLKITAQGSSYDSLSFLDQMTGNSSTVIKQMQEEYSTFMRGKNLTVNHYFENNEFLAYANASQKYNSLGPDDFDFELSVLNKADDKINSFTLEVPAEEGLDHVFVEDVQLVENKIYLITQNMVRNNGFNDEKHVYEIDVANQKLTYHEALLEYTQWKENVHTNIRLVESSPTAAVEQIILLKTEETMTEEIESMKVTAFEQEIISYNLETKEDETIKVPGFNLKENQVSFVKGSTIYFTRVKEQELIVTPYHLKENQFEQDFRIKLQATTIKEPFEHPMINVKEDKLYIVSRQINSSSTGDIVVVDMQTGKPLFEGQIALENSAEEQKNFELYMNQMYVKQ